jgi:hypothetical protein
MMIPSQQASNNESKKGLELNMVQFGVFASGGAWFAFGKRENQFAMTVGIGSGFRKLSDLPDDLRELGDWVDAHLEGKQLRIIPLC